jgi:RNA polymerase sigma-70 factor (ECF subfamily)
MGPFDMLCRLRELGREPLTRRRRLRRLAYRWCRNTTLADDLVQECFLKALKNLSQLRDVKAMDAWLFHIMHNCWLDHLRRERPSEDIDNLSDSEELAIDDRHDRADLIVRVRDAIGRLPSAQREVLELVDLHGYSYSEVAALLDIPTGTVTSRVSRAREALRLMLEDIMNEQTGTAETVVALRKAQ